MGLSRHERKRWTWNNGANNVVLYFYFPVLGKDSVVLSGENDALITHEFISDLSSLWVVELNSSNLNSDLIFLRHETFPACTLGVPTLVLTWLNHNLNQITCSQLAALTMWPSSYQKSAAFWGWSGIFPWEQPREQLSVRVSVCLRTLGKNLPPPPPFFPCLCFLQTLHYPPFFSLFSTTSHPLKHSITL